MSEIIVIILVVAIFLYANRGKWQPPRNEKTKDIQEKEKSIINTQNNDSIKMSSSDFQKMLREQGRDLSKWKYK